MVKESLMFFTMPCNKRLTAEIFKERSYKIHGDRYDYSEVEYVSLNSKVKIICKEHGSWWQLPSNHLAGKGCSYCSGTKVSKSLPINTKVPENSVAVPLTQGKFTIIDQIDVERVIKYNWVCANTGYAVGIVDGEYTLLHRFILGVKDTKVLVDHRGHDILDNRRGKLRTCTHKENSHNARSLSEFSSKYKGVCWDKHRCKWIVHITINNKYKHLGRFDNEEDAAKAYDKKAKEVFGEFAYLNFKD